MTVSRQMMNNSKYEYTGFSLYACSVYAVLDLHVMGK